MKKHNSIRSLWIAFSFAAILSSCNLSDRSEALTQTALQNSAGTIVAMTMQVAPTQPQAAIATQAFATPTETETPNPTPFPPNTPVWSAYNYTCEFTADGGTMTMSLAWVDRSNSEDGYKVYRGEDLIATLPADSTSYVDVAFVATGMTLSYSVEAFSADWQASTSKITYGCQ